MSPISITKKHLLSEDGKRLVSTKKNGRNPVTESDFGKHNRIVIDTVTSHRQMIHDSFFQEDSEISYSDLSKETSHSQHTPLENKVAKFFP